ncbi:MAG TPA: HDOD domain-containing protein [Ramlibacter sp.]|nr:HDOD domain-containing protein [Ramlibacter sp.]
MPHSHPLVSSWVARLGARPPPVLAATRETLLACRARADRLDANALAQVVLQDPLMAVRVLTVAQQRFATRLSRALDTVTAALVLLGIDPFFQAFAQLEAVEEHLAGRPSALAGFQRALTVAARAARLAAAFAVHQQDANAEVLYETALLADFGALLLWSEAPDEALALDLLLSAHPQIDTVQAQRQVLGVELKAIEAALMEQWNFPSLMREMAQPGLPAGAGHRMVALALRLAQLEQHGSEAERADAIADAARLLNMGEAGAKALVMEVMPDA